MPRHPRFRRWYSPAELNRFLHHLAATGNMAAAAAAIGRDVRGLYNRRRKDPLLAARCEAALAAFRSGPGPQRETFATQTRALQTGGGEWVLVRSGPQRGPQLRRAIKGQLTDAGLRQFLRALEATANLKLAAHSVGASPQAIASRRKRDVGFDQEVAEALKEGCKRLEMQLLESALRGLDGGAGKESLADDQDAARFAPRLTPMSAADAFALLQKQRELLSRPKGWSAGRDRQALELATARLEQALRRFGKPPRTEAQADEPPPPEPTRPQPEPPPPRAVPSIRRP